MSRIGQLSAELEHNLATRNVLALPRNTRRPSAEEQFFELTASDLLYLGLITLVSAIALAPTICRVALAMLEPIAIFLFNL